MGDLVLNIPLPPGSIKTGVISVSNRNDVARMPTIQSGHNSAVLIATDARQEGVEHRFYFRKRANEARPKQTLTRMKRFFRLHGLQPGDQIMLYVVEEELKSLGRVMSPALYRIDFKKKVHNLFK